MQFENKVLSKEILFLLYESGKTLATAESCTSGKVAESITLMPGASAYFTGGIVAYSEEVKKSLLNVPEELIEEAIRLRREVPKRSVVEIIRILEWEGLAEPGFLRKSTLQDQLAARGYSSRQMRTYAKDVTSARRFQKPWRNYLWQSDYPDVLFIPILFLNAA